MTHGRSRSDSRGSVDIAGTLNGRSARSVSAVYCPVTVAYAVKLLTTPEAVPIPGSAGQRPRNGYAIMYAMTEAAITVSALAKAYGTKQAVAGLDLTVDRGEVFALLGPNGAGKTTTVEILE